MSHCDVIDEVVITKVIVLDKIWNFDFTAKCEQFFIFVTIQYGRQMRHREIFETWKTLVLHLRFCVILILKKWRSYGRFSVTDTRDIDL